MLVNKARFAFVVLVGVMVPLSLAAQLVASVTVAPVGEAAPVLGMPLLGVLALLLAAAAAAALRQRPAVASTLVLVGLTVASVIGYAAIPTVTISGDECREITEKGYDSELITELVSDCPNPIRVIDLKLACGAGEHETLAEPPPPNLCEVGTIVLPGQSCTLPSCPC